MLQQSHPAKRSAFTLIELLVVIAIIAVLIGLLLPAVQKVREAGSRSKCQNTLKQLALACIQYESVHQAFPCGNAPSASHFTTGNNGASWLFMVLPYVEQENLYNQVRAKGTLAAAYSALIIPKVLPITRCPSDPWDLSNGALCNYVGSSGPQCNNTPTGNCDTPIFAKYCNGAPENQSQPAVPPTVILYPGYDASYRWGDTNDPSLVRGMFVRGGATIRRSMVSDGDSNTLFLGETLPEFCEFQRYTSYGWVGGNSVAQGQTIQPINWPIDPIPANGPISYSPNCQQTGTGACPSGPTHCMWNWHVTWGFKSRHPGGVNFAFVDGSVHFVTESINHQTYQYLGCRNDGQAVALP
jgi:prepilin-type N-terminal cleavage/methylation domain-containing protein/prepilin-type processing-associated H-X9-DG protein